VAECIREYRAQDFDELWRLDQSCFAPGIAYSRFELMRYIRRRNAFTLVAEDVKRQICGFAVAELQSLAAKTGGARQNAGHVITLDVRDDARRTGVGSRLMDEVESRLWRAGCRGVYLETAVNNQGAITFYKRRGYTVLRIVPRYYADNVDALLMGKSSPL
jgi:ribosomal-protein-alanine N-acetyltransferase